MSDEHGILTRQFAILRNWVAMEGPEVICLLPRTRKLRREKLFHTIPHPIIFYHITGSL